MAARENKYCKVAPNIFSLIIAGFFLDAYMFISSHAPSRKHQITVRFISGSKTEGPQHGTSLHHPSSKRLFLYFWKICGPLMTTA
jgi:hypothetical protein